MKTTITLVLFFISLLGYSQTEITINNLKPRIDTEGNIIDAHDGRISKFGNRFYWYGTAYSNTSGFVRSNYFQCYSSTDLMHWIKEGVLLIDKPSGVYYRPHVIYNARTNKYVLWYNWYAKLWEGKFGVAISDKPTGPFRIVDTDVKVYNSKEGVGDYGLFVDDDGAAYIAYNTINGHKGSIEKLREDYLSSTMENGGFITEGCEAGAIFKRNNMYYLLTDKTCCFCTQGSGARVYVSEHPTSGYKLRNNINRYPGLPSPAIIDKTILPNCYTTINRGKDTLFNSIQLTFSELTPINGIKIYQFTGNRNGSCGDTIATKVHDEITIPEFELLAKKNGQWVTISTKLVIEQTSVYNIVSLGFDELSTTALLIKPRNSYRYDQIFINEIKAFSGQKVTDVKQAFLIDNNSNMPIIPAQQTFVMPLKTTEGMQYIWMGDLWGSASDNIKGHDYQYWGAPLKFDANGNIETMDWIDEWKATIKE